MTDAELIRGCDHQEKEVRKRQVRGGTFQWAYQCLQCGRRVSDAIPKAVALSKCVPKPWDGDLEARWNQLVSDAQIRIRESDWKARNDYWWERYDAYMASPEWRERRSKVFERCRGFCEGCGKAQATHVHHLTYEHFGEEFLWELKAVCLGCHERVHGRKIGCAPQVYF